MLGVAFALVALNTRRLFFVFAALTWAASPLALLLLGVVVLGLRWWRAVAMVAPFVVLQGVLSLVYRAPGHFPFSWEEAGAAALFCVGAIALTRGRPIRGVFVAWLGLVALSFAFPSQLGENAARLRFMALPLALLVLRGRPLRIVVPLAVLAAAYNVSPLVWSFQKGHDERAEKAAYWAPTIRFLQSHADANFRVNALDTVGHWEAVYLPKAGIPITRGWFRQDDFPVNQPLYSRTLDPATFQAWLRSLGVRYVVLPNEELDYSSEQEAQILRSPGHGGLKLVSGDDPNVQIFELPDPTPILTAAAGGPAIAAHATAPIVHYLDRSSIAMALPAMGIYDLRVRYTPYWVSSDPAGVCVMPGGDGMTRLVAYRGGYVRLRFDVTLGESARQALGERNASCPALPAGTPGRF
jgi:hypothetical protein